MEGHVESILVGSLLGDGWLTRLNLSTEKSTYCVKYNDKSFGYLNWIHEQVMELEPYEIKEKPEYTQHHFYTKARKDIGELRKVFYPDEGEKRVPPQIKEMLYDPIALAIWYQDDGTLDRRQKYHWNIRIATYCFPYEDCVLLKETLEKNFGIYVSVCKCTMRNKVYYQLYVLSKSMNRFIEVVRPYIHKNYAYKIFSLN
jgi:hypothetical protein